MTPILECAGFLFRQSTKRLLLLAVGDRRRLFMAAVAAGAIMGVIPAAPTASAHDQPEKSFVASWAVGHMNPRPGDIAQYSNQTLREVVRTSVGGDHVRVRITNMFGTDTLVIGAAHIAVRSGCPVIPVTIEFSEPLLTKRSRWWLAPKVRPTVRVVQHPAIDPAQFLQGGRSVSLAARALTECLRELYVRELARRGST